MIKVETKTHNFMSEKNYSIDYTTDPFFVILTRTDNLTSKDDGESRVVMFPLDNVIKIQFD